MTKSKLVGERLEETLRTLFNEGQDCNGTMRNQCVSEAKSAILALFKSIIVESSCPGIGKDYLDGWDAARTELLKRLEEK